MLLPVCLVMLVTVALATPVNKKRNLHGVRVYLRPLAVKRGLDAFQGNYSDTATTAMPHGVIDANPEILPLGIHTEEEGRIHGLLLQRNFRIEHPVTITYNDGVTDEEYAPLNAEGHAQYHDNAGSIFGVKLTDGTQKFDGSFHVDGQRYEIHPIEADEGVRARGFEDHHPHLITKSTDHTFSEPLRLPEHEKIQITRNSEPRNTNYHIEMAIVVDYSEYLRWKTMLGSQSAAIEALKYKFAYTYNAMDYVYKSVQTGMTITVWLKRLEIQTSTANNFFLELNSGLDPALGLQQIVPAGEMLSAARAWGTQNGFAVPDEFDHVMYWASYDLSECSGMAYVRAICSSAAYSLVEDTGFESWMTAVHELGHSLGAGHDTGTGDCATSKNHVMSPYISIADAEFNKDGFSFSTCSLADMTQTLSSETCVHNCGCNDFAQSSDRSLPGKKYDADWQCKWRTVGYDGSKSCHGKIVYDTECYNGLSCTRESGRCITWGYPPADGTPCTGGKQCLRGLCQ